MVRSNEFQSLYEFFQNSSETDKFFLYYSDYFWDLDQKIRLQMMIGKSNINYKMNFELLPFTKEDFIKNVQNYGFTVNISETNNNEITFDIGWDNEGVIIFNSKYQ